MKKNIVITGGSNGIGLELVRHYLNKNDTIYTTYFNSKKELIELKKKYGNKLFFEKMDLANNKDISNFAKNIKKNSKTLDIIILNALDKIKRKKFNKISKAEITKSINRNFLGNFFFLQIFSKFFLLKGKINLLHISSMVSKKGSWGLSNYGPSKAAVDNLFKCLQYEFKNKVKFKSIYLGAVDTRGYRYTNGVKNIYKTIKIEEAVLKIIKIIK